MGVIYNKARIEDLSARMDATDTAVTDAATTANTANTAINALHPDGTSLVLNSSTSESTKRFAITVDDDGLITATEITFADPPLPAGE